MKFVSPTQRGSTCTWRCPGTPAPAARPRFMPTLTPSGWYAASTARVASRVIAISAVGLVVGRARRGSPSWRTRRDHQVPRRVRVGVQHREDAVVRRQDHPPRRQSACRERAEEAARSAPALRVATSSTYVAAPTRPEAVEPSRRSSGARRPRRRAARRTRRRRRRARARRCRAGSRRPSRPRRRRRRRRARTGPSRSSPRRMRAPSVSSCAPTQLDAEALGPQPVGDPERVRVVAVGDREDRRPAPARATSGTRPRSARAGSRRSARSTRTARGGS